MTEHICRACRHAHANAGFAAHYKAGLRNCALKPAHIFVPGHHSCTNWSARATKAMEV